MMNTFITPILAHAPLKNYASHDWLCEGNLWNLWIDGWSKPYSADFLSGQRRLLLRRFKTNFGLLNQWFGTHWDKPVKWRVPSGQVANKYPTACCHYGAHLWGPANFGHWGNHGSPQWIPWWCSMEECYLDSRFENDPIFHTYVCPWWIRQVFHGRLGKWPQRPGLVWKQLRQGC